MKTTIPSNVLKSFETSQNKISFHKGAIALFIRNIKILWQYKFNIIMGFVNTLLVCSLFYYISLLVPEQVITQDNYIVSSLSFIFAGVILTELSTKILLKAMNSFTSEMKQGTFETLSTLSFGLEKYFISEILFEVFYSVILSIIYFFLVFLIYKAAGHFL